MLETLKKLNTSRMISLDNEKIHRLTNAEDFTVEDIELYQSDHNEIVIIRIAENFLVSHTFDDDPRYFVFEEYHVTDQEDITEDIREIDVSGGGSLRIFEQEEDSPYYELISNQKEITVFTYHCREEDFIEDIMAIQFSNDILTLQGFEISEDSIVI